jgi:capsular polysaccharide biosynthesis protein
MGKIKQYFQKININREYFSLRFLLAGIILSISFLLLFINLSKTYTSSMTIFVNAKSEIAAEQKDQIIGNIAEFPKTLALYDRLLKYNSDVKDVAAGESSAERKKMWNEMLSVRKVGKDSSLIKISITTAQKNDAEQLVKKTTETLFHFTAFYYNIKDDVDLRIIDSLITRASIFGWYWILPLSLIFGFLVTSVLQYILIKRRAFLISRYNESKEKFLFNLNQPVNKESQESSAQDEMKSLEDLYMSDIPAKIPTEHKKTFSETITSGIQEMKKMTKTFEKNKYPNFSEVPKHAQVTASAPDNLPIADDSFFGGPNLNAEQPKHSENIEIKKEPEIKIHPEPNMEQLKKRLNDLLRGEL